MGGIFYWTGAVVWIAVAAAVVWFVVIELCVVGLATSISYHRWAISGLPNFRWRKHWAPLLRNVLTKAVTEFYGYRNRGNYTVSNRATGAAWKGIGDWDKQEPPHDH